MNLYTIYQDTNNGYDTYDTALVAAETEEEAKRIDPSDCHVWSDEEESWIYEGRVDNHDSWVTVDKVSAEYMGKAKDDLRSGLIFSSFNAG